MKITDMRVECYSWPKRVPQSNGKHTYTHDGRNFVFIETDEGITGVGLSTPGLIGSNAPGLEEYFSHTSASIEPSSYIHLRLDPNEALCTMI